MNILSKFVSFFADLFSPNKPPEKNYRFVSCMFDYCQCCMVDDWLNSFSANHQTIVDIWISNIGDRMFCIVKIEY
jgi:hypothetical protein